MSLTRTEKKEDAVELAEQETNSKIQVLLENKLTLLEKADSYLDLVSEFVLKISEGSISTEISQIFPRGDKEGYHHPKQLLFDGFHKLEDTLIDPKDIEVARNRVQELREQLTNLQTAFSRAENGYFSPGLIVKDPDGTLHLVLDAVDYEGGNSQYLFLLSVHNHFRDNLDQTRFVVEDDPSSYSYFLTQIASKWFEFNIYALEGIWEEKRETYLDSDPRVRTKPRFAPKPFEFALTIKSLLEVR
jgi:hypothetical protein